MYLFDLLIYLPVLSYTSPIYYVQDETIYFMKGAPEKVLAQCKSYFKNDMSEPLVESCRKSLLETAQNMGGRGLRGNFGCFEKRVVYFQKDFYKFVWEKGCTVILSLKLFYQEN